MTSAATATAMRTTPNQGNLKPEKAAASSIPSPRPKRLCIIT
jgi:hypothetical protein